MIYRRVERSLISAPARSRSMFHRNCSLSPDEMSFGPLTASRASPKAARVSPMIASARLAVMTPHEVASATIRSTDMRRWSKTPSRPAGVGRPSGLLELHAPQHQPGQQRHTNAPLGTQPVLFAWHAVRSAVSTKITAGLESRRELGGVSDDIEKVDRPSGDVVR
jgi:hypothetical protein